MLILCHNVYWFQGHPIESMNRGVLNQKAYLPLVSLYKKLNPDLIFLQEIQSDLVANTIARDLNKSYYFQEGDGIPYYGGAVLFDKKLECQPVQLFEKGVFQRFCQVIKIKINGKNFHFCNVHLPYATQISEEEAILKRFSEMQTILNCDISLDFVCGDLNENPHLKVTTLLENLGYFDSFSNIEGECLCTTKGGKRGDYIFIKNTLKNMVGHLNILDLRIKEMEISESVYLSDHFPLLLNLKLS